MRKAHGKNAKNKSLKEALRGARLDDCWCVQSRVVCVVSGQGVVADCREEPAGAAKSKA
jgi:hypothetical protein